MVQSCVFDGWRQNDGGCDDETNDGFELSGSLGKNIWYEIRPLPSGWTCDTSSIYLCVNDGVNTHHHGRQTTAVVSSHERNPEDYCFINLLVEMCMPMVRPPRRPGRATDGITVHTARSRCLVNPTFLAPFLETTSHPRHEPRVFSDMGGRLGWFVTALLRRLPSCLAGLVPGDTARESEMTAGRCYWCGKESSLDEIKICVS